MTMAEPVWFKYCVWDYSDPMYPVLVGLRKDTPPGIVEQFERDQESFRKAEEEGIIL